MQILKQPTLKTSTDVEWREYYENKCLLQRKEIGRLELTRDRLIGLLQKLGYDVTHVLRVHPGDKGIVALRELLRRARGVIEMYLGDQRPREEDVSKLLKQMEFDPDMQEMSEEHERACDELFRD